MAGGCKTLKKHGWQAVRQSVRQSVEQKASAAARRWMNSCKFHVVASFKLSCGWKTPGKKHAFMERRMNSFKKKKHVLLYIFLLKIATRSFLCCINRSRKSVTSMEWEMNESFFVFWVEWHFFSGKQLDFM